MIDREAGVATVSAVVSVGLMVGLAWMAIALLAAAGSRAEVETAADAAALAAVGAAALGDDPCTAAGRLAAANGARLLECRCPPFAGEPIAATVVVGRSIDVPLIGERVVSASASAEFRPDP